MYTNIGLVEHAKKALKERWGYVYGTFGTTLTEQLLKDKLKQYPSNVVAYESFIRANWMGKMVTDCVGLIKSYLWWNGVKAVYSSLYDVSANGMYERAKEKGAINTIPEIPGLCVWRNGHIGVYIGNGEVIESRGTKYGVVKTKIKERTFTHWLKCPFIVYEEPKKEEPKPITIKVNGNVIQTDVAPVNANGRVLVPVRAIAEALGCKVEWDGTNNIVSILVMPNQEVINLTAERNSLTATVNLKAKAVSELLALFTETTGNQEILNRALQIAGQI